MPSAALLAAYASQAPAQAAVEEPGYCAQYYQNSKCTNYGPGNPLYPGSHVPSGPAGNYYNNGYDAGPYGAAVPGGALVHHRHRHHAYR